LRERLINNGKEFVKEYSWFNVAKKIERFYIEKLKELNQI